MEIRKLIQSGPSSLVVALPQKWVEGNVLKKGDQVSIDNIENRLVISTFSKSHEETKFIIEKNRDTSKFLDTLLYAGFLSDKRTIVLENIEDADFYELLKLLKKFQYLKLDERSKKTVKLVFVVDAKSVDLEKDLSKIAYFFDLLFQLFTDDKCKKEDLQEAYDQISTQILLCMKILKLNFLDYNKNTVLKMKQQLDSYYFLLISCKNLISQFRTEPKNKKIVNEIERLRQKLSKLISLIKDNDLIGTLNFWHSNDKEKEDLLERISKERDAKTIHFYFIVYNALSTLENIAYSFFNNR